jgi:uncharacterized sporulation protein YeaH/YhbH (DUF444 family)
MVGFLKLFLISEGNFIKIVLKFHLLFAKLNIYKKLNQMEYINLNVKHRKSESVTLKERKNVYLCNQDTSKSII